PEQWGAGEVDALSDVWALGIMFWRALVGVHPAGMIAADTLRARLLDLETPLPSIGSRLPELPRGLVAIVDACLEKKKERRCPSAGALLGELIAFLQPQEAGDACPYRGLAAFGEEDARFFFGRTTEIRSAMAHLESWPLLAVVGPSGVGKSSFVHAGVIPAMRAAGACDVHVLRPGRMPIHRLASVLGEDPQLVARLVEAPGLFGQLLRASGRRVVVV